MVGEGRDRGASTRPTGLSYVYIFDIRSGVDEPCSGPRLADLCSGLIDFFKESYTDAFYDAGAHRAAGHGGRYRLFREKNATPLAGQPARRRKLRPWHGLGADEAPLPARPRHDALPVRRVLMNKPFTGDFDEMVNAG
jgi:hypothetical protein